MTDWLLALIALGTLTTAVLQVVVIASLLRTGRRLMARASRLQAMLAPLPAHFAEASAHLARAHAVAESRVASLSSLYALVESPLRKGFAALAVAKGANQMFRRLKPRRTPHQSNS